MIRLAGGNTILTFLKSWKIS